MDARELLLQGAEALRAGDARTAAERAEAILRADPDSGAGHLLHGRALLGLNASARAAEALRRAVKLVPDSSEAHASLGLALQAQGLVEEPFAAFTRALELDPESPRIQVRTADFLFRQGHLDEAQSLYLMAARQDELEALAGLVNVMERRGDLDAALELIEANEAALDHSFGLRLAAARLLRRRGRHEEALARLEAVSPSDLSVQAELSLQYALGDVRDELGDPDAAFAAWRRANELRGLRFDAEAHARRVQALIDAYPPGSFDTLPRAANDSELPILIVGVPRSGTSLTEQILAAHPCVYGAGELDDLNEIARSRPQDAPETLDAAAERYLARLGTLSAGAGPDIRRVTDKMPHNALHLGLAAQLIPGARVVSCRRDPLDTGLSCFSRDFHETHDYATDLESIGVFIRLHRRLMAHWGRVLPLPIFELRYEELVAEPERVSRELLEFCGLDWDPAVLRFHESGREVRTASYDQVRRPIYTNAMGRAARYARHLDPLRRGLEG